MRLGTCGRSGPATSARRGHGRNVEGVRILTVDDVAGPPQVREVGDLLRRHTNDGTPPLPNFEGLTRSDNVKLSKFAYLDAELRAIWRVSTEGADAVEADDPHDDAFEVLDEADLLDGRRRRDDVSGAAER